TNQVRAARRQNEGSSLNVGVADPEIKVRVTRNFFGEMIDDRVEFRIVPVEIAVHDQRQQLVMARSPRVLGGREQVGTIGIANLEVVWGQGISIPKSFIAR